jgi:hypothetical protein
VFAKDSDHSAILPGKSFNDPVFQSFKVDFAGGMNIGDNSSDRQVISITRAGDDKLQVSGLFTDSSGADVPFSFAKNWTTGYLELQNGDYGKNISVMEGQSVYKG